MLVFWVPEKILLILCTEKKEFCDLIPVSVFSVSVPVSQKNGTVSYGLVRVTNLGILEHRKNTVCNVYRKTGIFILVSKPVFFLSVKVTFYGLIPVANFGILEYQKKIPLILCTEIFFFYYFVI